MKHLERTFGVLLAMLVAFVVASAPGTASADKGGQRAKVEARRAQIRERILREIGIGEAKGKQVEGVLKKYEPERKKLLQEQRGYKQTLKKLLRDDSGDEQAYKKAIEGLRSTQRKLHSTREKELDELAKLLTPKQQAKLAAALLRLRRHMQKSRPEGAD